MNVNVNAPIATLGMAMVVIAACRPTATPTAPTPDPRPHDGSSTSAEHAPDPAEAPQIRSDGIGPVVLGAPIPAHLATADRYALRLYADAQPLEGFFIGDPSVFAALADGPYRRWLTESGEIDVPPADRFAADAVRDATGGTVVEMAYVEAPGITTTEGVGVGTLYGDFMGAYPDADVGRMPPLFEDPTCMGQTGALPRVHFFFDRCPETGAPPPDARIVRIAVR